MILSPNLVFLTKLETWQDKYEAILEFGQTLEPLAAEFKTEKYRVAGCQSRVWLVLEWQNEKLQIQVEADSRLVQGLLALVVEVYSGRTKGEITEIGNGWIAELGLNKNLSMVRRSGLDAVVRKVLEF